MKRSSDSIFKDICGLPYTSKHSNSKLSSSCKGSKDMLQRMKMVKSMPVHHGCVNTLCWNSAGDCVLSGSDDQHLLVTNCFTYKVVADHKTSHRANIFSAKYLCDNLDKNVVSCSGDGIILYTDMSRASETQNNQFSCHYGTTYEVQSVPSEPYSFLSCGEDGTVRWYDLRVKTSCTKPDCKEDILISYQGAVTALSVSSARPYQLAIGCSDSTVRIFDRRNLGTRYTGGYTPTALLRPICSFCAPELDNISYRITSLKFSPEGDDVLVSYSSDYLYLFSIKDLSSMQMSCNTHAAERNLNSGSRGTPPVKRLRLRGDWSDTGPDARPEREGGRRGGEPVAQVRPTLQATLMQRMTDVLARMLNDPATRAALSGAAEQNNALPIVHVPLIFPPPPPLLTIEEGMAIQARQREQEEREQQEQEQQEREQHMQEQHLRMAPQQVGATLTAENNVDWGGESTTGPPLNNVDWGGESTTGPPLNNMDWGGESTTGPPLNNVDWGGESTTGPPLNNMDWGGESTTGPPLNNVDWGGESTTGPPLGNVDWGGESTTGPPLNNVDWGGESTTGPPLNNVEWHDIFPPPPLLDIANFSGAPTTGPPQNNVSWDIDSTTGQHLNNMNESGSANPPIFQGIVDWGGDSTTRPPQNIVEWGSIHDYPPTEGIVTGNSNLLPPLSSLSLQPMQLLEPIEPVVHLSPDPPSRFETLAREAAFGYGRRIRMTQSGIPVFLPRIPFVDYIPRMPPLVPLPPSMRYVPCQPDQKIFYVEGGQPDRSVDKYPHEEDLSQPSTSGSSSSGEAAHQHAADLSQPSTSQSQPSSSAEAAHQYAVDLAQPSTSQSQPSSSAEAAHQYAIDLAQPSSSGTQVFRPIQHEEGYGNKDFGDSDDDDDDDEEDEDIKKAVINDAVMSAPQMLSGVYKRPLHPIEVHMEKAMAAIRGESTEHFVEPIAPKPIVKQKYIGHRNARTMIKEASFWGSDFVMSGSDCGHVFVWDRETGELVMLLEADKHVVNCLQPHPYLPLLATSGIDYDVKLWAPVGEEPNFDKEMAEELMRRNEIMLDETRDTITVPASFMIRMLACLNQIRRGGRTRSRNSRRPDGDNM